MLGSRKARYKLETCEVKDLRPMRCDLLAYIDNATPFPLLWTQTPTPWLYNIYITEGLYGIPP